MEQSKKILSRTPLPAVLIPLPLIPFSTEEITGCTNEAAKSANKTPRNPLSCFSISHFLFQKFHQLIHLNLLMIL